MRKILCKKLLAKFITNKFKGKYYNKWWNITNDGKELLAVIENVRM